MENSFFNIILLPEIALTIATVILLLIGLFQKKNSFKNKQLKQTIEKHTMLNRWGTPEDLIGPAIFLASDSSRYLTGQDIYVDGGWLANSLVGSQ